MAEYIEREAALNICQKEYEERLEMCDYCGDTVAWNIGGQIKKLPAADVEVVKHGKWDCIPNTYMSVVSKDGAYHGNATTCSACHEVNPNAYKTNYCPNCGAKMGAED